MNNVKSNINPFDEVKYGKDLQKVLQIRLPGYGEKREKRVTVNLENAIYQKTAAKCSKIHCAINEAVNQLLYIWSKGININETFNNPNDNIEGEKSFYRVIGYSRKRDRQIDLLLEPTIFQKSMTKCERGGYTLTDAVNKVLYLWTHDVKDAGDNDGDENQMNLLSDYKESNVN